MDTKLTKEGQKDIGSKYSGVRPGGGEVVTGLAGAEHEEKSCRQEPGDGCLGVPQLDALQSDSQSRGTGMCK